MWETRRKIILKYDFVCLFSILCVTYLSVCVWIPKPTITRKERLCKVRSSAKICMFTKLGTDYILIFLDLEFLAEKYCNYELNRELKFDSKVYSDSLCPITVF